MKHNAEKWEPTFLASREGLHKSLWTIWNGELETEVLLFKGNACILENLQPLHFEILLIEMFPEQPNLSKIIIHSLDKWHNLDCQW